MAAALQPMVQVHIARETSPGTYEFLLLKRSLKQALYPSLWQVITGKRKGNETFIQAAIREIEEETNLAPAEMWALPFVATFYLPQTDSVHHSPVFGALVDSLKECKISGEHQEFVWATAGECFKKLVMPSHKEGTEIFLKEILLKENREIFKIHRF